MISWWDQVGIDVCFEWDFVIDVNVKFGWLVELENFVLGVFLVLFVCIAKGKRFH